MRRVLSVYCSGSIAKGAADQKKTCWTDREREEIQVGAGDIEVVFLNPDDPITDPTNTLGQFGRDMHQVQIASAVVVDARERRGLGIGVEMAAAATMGTPIIVVAPQDSKYRASELEYRGVTVVDYVHPHVASLATAVVDDFIQAGQLLEKCAAEKQPNHPIPQWLELAINEYKDNVLTYDTPMISALAKISDHSESDRRI